MPDGSIDPGSLEGDALTCWYMRSPAESEQERQAAAAKRYQDFFYGPPGADPDPGFAREPPAADHDVDPGFAAPLPFTSQDVEPGFTWVQVGPNRLRSVRLTSGDPSADPLSPDLMSYGGDASAADPSAIAQYQDSASGSGSETDLTPQPIAPLTGELRGPPTVAYGPSPVAASPHGSASAAMPPVRSSAALSRAPIAYGRIPANPPSHQARPTAAAARPPSSVGHPGFAESLIPIWGSGREAVADFQEGDYAGAALNGALVASDLFLAESIAKGLAKGGFYVAKKVATKAPYDWKKVVRPWMGKQGFLEFGQHGHHWAIPQKGWGKQIPDFIKNQPWNIKPMPSAEVHGRITGPYKGKPQLNVAERYWYGTPAWSKVATAATVGHPLAAANAQSDQRK